MRKIRNKLLNNFAETCSNVTVNMGFFILQFLIYAVFGQIQKDAGKFLFYSMLSGIEGV